MKVKVLRTGAICLLLLVTAMIITSVAIEEYPVNATPHQTIRASELHDQVNQERTKLGLPGLTRDRRLDKSAIEKCNDMELKNYMSHTMADGSEFYVLIRKHSNYIRAGENLASGYNTTEEVVSNWMESPTHKANIIEPAYINVGYGVCMGDDYQYGNAVDGSAVTDITINDGLMLIEIDAAEVTWQDIYAYEMYYLFTSTGIQDLGQSISSPDTANYLMDSTVLKLKNISGSYTKITGGWGRDVTSGDPLDIIDFTGDPLFGSPPHVVAYATGGATATKYLNTETGDLLIPLSN